MKSTFKLLVPAIAAAMTLSASAAPAAKPLKALLVIGGCCHDYGVQKGILEAGIEARTNIQVDVCYSDDKSTKATFTCYEKENWAEGYDVIIHDECSADIKDPAVVNRILDAHRKGVPGVNLHCAMHCYRTSPDFGKPLADGAEGAMWFDYLGLQSSGHGSQLPIAVSYTDSGSPITKGFENWTTIKEELYNNIRVHDSAKALAKGKQGDSETVIVWTNEYGDKKTRVFSTTLGHNNETVSDTRYLDLVTRGLLWTCNKLDKDGKPAAGYEPAAAK
ncbi:MAG: ThuA domain-containing protein [Luteolibacter sp.]|uniref:ThuA domain-containing protein n=1 Tax=Luteolibacter sp. TaxID=1962973 RepID=UPI003266BA1F